MPEAVSRSEAGAQMYRRRERLPFRTLDGETVILNPRESGVHVLNGTGSLIWQLLDRSRSVSDVVSLLNGDGRFDADADEMVRDVNEFLEELVRRGLLVTGEQAPPAEGG